MTKHYHDLTPEQRSRRARIAGLISTSKPGYNGREATAKARQAAWQKLLDTVDPEGVDSPEERERKAKRLRSARLLQGRWGK